jgi:hypothetical protein
MQSISSRQNSDPKCFLQGRDTSTCITILSAVPYHLDHNNYAKRFHGSLFMSCILYQNVFHNSWRSSKQSINTIEQCAFLTPPEMDVCKSVISIYVSYLFYFVFCCRALDADMLIKMVVVQEKVDEVYRNQQQWTKQSILSTAGTAFFSSDRTIQEYADKIWRCEPCPVPLPTFSDSESP